MSATEANPTRVLEDGLEDVQLSFDDASVPGVELGIDRANRLLRSLRDRFRPDEDYGERVNPTALDINRWGDGDLIVSIRLSVVDDGDD
jgi:hypothetical protein